MSWTVEIQIAGKNDGKVEKISDELLDIIENYFNSMNKDFSDVYAKMLQDKSIVRLRKFFGNQMDFLDVMKGGIEDEVKKLYETEHHELIK